MIKKSLKIVGSDLKKNKKLNFRQRSVAFIRVKWRDE